MQKSYNGLELLTNGEVIDYKDEQFAVPDHPIISFIEGDGTWRNIWKASWRVFDAVPEKGYGGKSGNPWFEIARNPKIFYFCYRHNMPRCGQKHTYSHVDTLNAQETYQIPMRDVQRSRQKTWVTGQLPGIEADGKRTLTRTAAGAIDNADPIVIVHEAWSFAEFQLVLAESDENPLGGNRQSEITSMAKSNPPLGLFQLTQGMTIRDLPAASGLRIPVDAVR